MIKRFPTNMKIFKQFKQLTISKCTNSMRHTKFTHIRDALKNFVDKEIPIDI